MKPPPFQYHDPKTLAEAVGLLGTLDNAKLLAGGQSLMPMLNMRFVLPDHVIDLNLVEGLSGIKESGGALEIGAMTRQRDLEFSDLVKAKCPLLHQAIMHIGHRQTRNRGTIGGSLCHLDPAAELVSVCAAHDATVDGRGAERHARDRVRGFPRRLSDARDRTERDRDRRSAFRSGRPGTRRRSSSSPAATAISPSCRRRRCCRSTAARSRAPRSPSAASRSRRCAPPRSRRPSPARRRSSELFAKACESCRSFEAMADIHASADYRQHLAAVLSRRALEKAAGLADNAPWNRVH